MDSCGSSPIRGNGSERRHGFCWDELPSGRIELADAALFVVRLLLFLIPEREYLVDVGGPVGMLVFDPVWFTRVFRSFHGYYWNLFSHERQEEQSVNSYY